MSKLSKLRGSAATPVAIFADNAEKSVQSVFERMMSTKPSAPKTTPQKKTFTPSRFRVAKGDNKRLVVLDDKFTFGMREHSLQGPDGKWTTERCISEWDACPLCTKDGVSVSDVAFLTVLDLTPWTKTNADGTKTEYEYTKRVLAIKKASLPAFSSLLNLHGSFRGLVLDMARGHGDKEAASGSPTFVAKLEEDDLVSEFGSEQVLSEAGKVIRPANDAIYPYAYERYYNVPSRMELQRKYGLGALPGSDSEDNGPPFDVNDSITTIGLNEEVAEEGPLDLAAQLPEVF